jgi:hypothetical protein
MRTGYGTKFLGPGNSGEANEVADRVLVSTLCAGILDVGKPLGFRRYVCQILKLGDSEAPLAGGDLRRELHDPVVNCVWSIGPVNVGAQLVVIGVDSQFVVEPIAHRRGRAPISVRDVFLRSGSAKNPSL